MAGMAAISLGLGSGCSFTRLASCNGRKAAKNFARLRLEPECVLRSVVGLRPYRPSGFMIRAEPINEKTVVHNYGHGGAGVSLSWGTARIAVEEALKSGKRKAAVIGSGCVGLATARLLREKGFGVTIYAKELPLDTTSNAAGALWSPFAVADWDRCSPDFPLLLEKIARMSHRYFEQLEGDEYGIRWIESYIVSSHPIERTHDTQAIQDLYPDRKMLKPGEHPFDAPYVERVSNMLIDMPVYLSALLRDVSRDGAVVIREFECLDDVLSLNEPVIMNCMGLGAKQVFGDPELMPIRGQTVILRPQPEIDYCTSWRDEALLMLPRKDGIVLGSTYEPWDWSHEPDPGVTAEIVEAHRRAQNSMKWPAA